MHILKIHIHTFTCINTKPVLRLTEHELVRFQNASLLEKVALSKLYLQYDRK